MLKVCDIAEYILQKQGPMSAMKLQKLVYYSQAFSLALDDQPLFKEDFEAWTYGPVCRELYEQHRGVFLVSAVKENLKEIPEKQRSRINDALKKYGSFDGVRLSEITHAEPPWVEARKRHHPTSGLCREVITQESMKQFYRNDLSLSSIPKSEQEAVL